MTKSTKKSKLKGKKVNLVGYRDASKAINTYPVPLRQENSDENKETSQTVPEEEPSRNGAKKSASRRKARQRWVIFKDIREVWSSRAERCLRRSLLKHQVERLKLRLK